MAYERYSGGTRFEFRFCFYGLGLTWCTCCVAQLRSKIHKSFGCNCNNNQFWQFANAAYIIRYWFTLSLSLYIYAISTRYGDFGIALAYGNHWHFTWWSPSRDFGSICTTFRYNTTHTLAHGARTLAPRTPMDMDMRWNFISFASESVSESLTSNRGNERTSRAVFLFLFLFFRR